MAFDEPSAQLHLELRKAVQAALASRRPILHHLNADTSWFLQIPRPDSAVKHGSRFYYNILIDPWLTGGQSDLASWFSQQFHATQSAIQSIAELEELAREIEILASGLRLGYGRKSNVQADEEDDRTESYIDAVVISHEFTDHCHKETLLEVHPDVTIFAVKEAAKLIQSWKHFRSVVTIPVFGANGDQDWRSTSLPPLPDWIGIARLLQHDDVLNFHSALMITFNNQHRDTKSELTTAKTNGTINSKRKRHHTAIELNEDEESAEAIIYTPHGINSSDLSLIPSASPSIRPLAFLHGLHNVKVGQTPFGTALQNNLGAHNGLKAQRLLNAKYWIGTHDEVKTSGGLVSYFLSRKVISIGEALEEERKTRKNGAVDRELDKTLDASEDANWVELGNGESKILEL